MNICFGRMIQTHAGDLLIYVSAPESLWIEIKDKKIIHIYYVMDIGPRITRLILG
jgi:hypothetical protein